MFIDFRGSSSWARTSDIMINSHALCQLSYRGIYINTKDNGCYIAVIFVLSLIPAAFYFPGQSPTKYHRRKGA